MFCLFFWSKNDYRLDERHEVFHAALSQRPQRLALLLFPSHQASSHRAYFSPLDDAVISLMNSITSNIISADAIADCCVLMQHVMADSLFSVADRRAFDAAHDCFKLGVRRIR